MSEIAQIPAENLVFLDEAGVHLAMTRPCARAPIGKRASCYRPAARGGNISLVGAVRLSGVSALYPYDGAIDGDKFLSYLDEHLLPVLRPGDVLVMDNLRVHHIAAVKEKLTPFGVRALYLPPYSPELNPIEETWSLVKRVFQKLEARNIGAFIDALNVAVSAVTESVLKGVFQHAGYGEFK